MQQAYFCDIRNQIIPLLKNAMREIRIAMAWFTSSEIFDTMLECCQKGIKIDLILLNDANNFMNYAPDFNEFIKAGGILRIANRDIGLMHHKFCVVDDTVVITGSYNWTYNAETNNIENILITDDKDVIHQYQNAFKSLADRLNISSKSPRLTWDDIEHCDDVDFYELNNELKYISKAKNLPIRKVYQPSSKVVQILEIKKKPYSCQNVGIQFTINGKEAFYVIIQKDKPLPCVSDWIDMKLNADSMMKCDIRKGPDKDLRKTTSIHLASVSQIAQGSNKEQLSVSLQMSLNENGYLKISIKCSDTGKKMDINTIDSNIVRYE